MVKNGGVYHQHLFSLRLLKTVKKKKSPVASLAPIGPFKSPEANVNPMRLFSSQWCENTKTKIVPVVGKFPISLEWREVDKRFGSTFSVTQNSHAQVKQVTWRVTAEKHVNRKLEMWIWWGSKINHC